IGQGAAHPPLADERHAGPAGLALDDFLRLALGAHEHHQAAARHHLREVLVGSQQAADGFAQVDDVDQVPLAVDVRPHLRVPPAGSVTVVDARFEENFHVYESHDPSFEDSATITRFCCMTRPTLQLRGMETPPTQFLRRKTGSITFAPETANPPCE